LRIKYVKHVFKFNTKYENKHKNINVELHNKGTNTSTSHIEKISNFENKSLTNYRED